MKNITIKPNYLLIEPLASSSSEFSSEQRKYERKSIAKVIKIGDSPITEQRPYKVGDTIIYNDSHSVDFSLDGKDYSVISIEEAYGIIREEA